LQILCQATKIKFIVINLLGMSKGDKTPESVQIIGYFNFLNLEAFFCSFGRWGRIVEIELLCLTFSGEWHPGIGRCAVEPDDRPLTRGVIARTAAPRRSHGTILENEDLAGQFS
jgi:hypothetical protein